jgi:hypothetical protein
MDYHPKPPFTSWARQWVHPSYGFGWVSLDPLFLITQANHSRATVEASEALSDFVDETVANVGVEHARHAVVIHDWRMVREVDPKVRRAWLARVKRRPPDFPRAAASYIALSTSGQIRMTLQVASLAHQLATGQPPVRIVSDPAEPLAEHGFTVPNSPRVSVRPPSTRF